MAEKWGNWYSMYMINLKDSKIMTKIKRGTIQIMSVPTGFGTQKSYWREKKGK